MTTPTAPRLVWLTGCNTEATRALAHRSDVGLLGTPAGGTIAARHRYAGGWAVDNGCFAETPPAPSSTAWHPTMPEHCVDPIARAIRFDLPSSHKVRALLDRLDPAEAPRFVSLPDVVGNYRATWERSSHHIAAVLAQGWPIAIVAQTGLEADRFVLGSILNALEYSAEVTGAGVLFLGGSTEWKLGPGARYCAEAAQARGLAVHMGRVNTARRLRYAASIGCTSCDGTAARNGPVPVDLIRRTLDAINDPPPALFAA